MARADDEERAQWVTAYARLGSHIQVGCVFGRDADTVKRHLIAAGVFVPKDKASIQRGRRRTIASEVGVDVVRKSQRRGKSAAEKG
jgi:hypothetical protein